MPREFSDPNRSQLGRSSCVRTVPTNDINLICARSPDRLGLYSGGVFVAVRGESIPVRPEESGLRTSPSTTSTATTSLRRTGPCCPSTSHDVNYVFAQTSPYRSQLFERSSNPPLTGSRPRQTDFRFGSTPRRTAIGPFIGEDHGLMSHVR